MDGGSDHFIGDWLYCFKDEAFSEEKEWRLIYQHDSIGSGVKYFKFRTSRGLLLPYISLRLLDPNVFKEEPYFPIKKIWIGPTLDPELGEKALRMFLRNQGYEHSIEIKPSLIPLRRI